MLTHFLREYNVNKIFLSILGLWPYQSKIMRILLPTFCILLQSSYIPFEILTFIDNSYNADMKFESCYQFVISIAFISRILNQIWYHDKLRWLYETMDNHWNIFSSDAEIQIMRHYSLFSRKITILYAMLFYSLLPVLIIKTFIPPLLDIVLPLNESRARIFIVDVNYRMDNSEYYVLVYCYTIMIAVIGLSVMISFDGMYFTCCIHAWSLFLIVGEQMENIISKVGNHNEIKEYECRMNMELDLSSEEILYREYITCLKKYQLAIKFVNILNSSYEIFLLIVLLLITVCTSAVGIRMIDMLSQFGEMVKFLSILGAAFTQLMIICYTGQRILDGSQNIFYRAYAMEWYNVSPRLKTLLLITLYRSNVPCRLMAGNMFTLSMTTYAAVARMSMSYFTAFLSLKG